MMDPIAGGQPASEDDEAPGFFRSWGSLYVSVVVYTVVSILLLYWITVALDFRVS
jgi:hypothetical protein